MFMVKHHIVFIFENGKGVRIPVSAYETKSNRRKLSGAFSSSSPIVAAFYESEPIDIFMMSDSGKAILIRSTLIPEMSTRTSSGVSLFTLKKTQKITAAVSGESIQAYPESSKCKKIKIPATGVTLSSLESGKKQLSFE